MKTSKEDTEKEELEETPEEEASESTEKQQKEEVEGNEAVKIPEDFQKKSYELIHEMCDTQAKCEYLRNCIWERESEIRKQERESKKGDKETPNAVVHFTDSEEPY